MLFIQGFFSYKYLYMYVLSNSFILLSFLWYSQSIPVLLVIILTHYSSVVVYRMYGNSIIDSYIWILLLFPFPYLPVFNVTTSFDQASINQPAFTSSCLSLPSPSDTLYYFTFTKSFFTLLPTLLPLWSPTISPLVFKFLFL